MSDCYACRLTAGEEPLPGGRVMDTEYWVVEHCTGPLGVGTLILKPLRHCTRLSDLTPEEASELGSLVHRVAAAVESLTRADQVYSCLWSHANWRPGHIHFVLQPSWERYRDRYSEPGVGLQRAMFEERVFPEVADVEVFCQRARQQLGTA